MSITRLLTTCAMTFTLASFALAEQIVYLNFGSATETQEKEDQAICNADDPDNPLIVMKKKARMGFLPTDLGFKNNDNRAMCIQELVDQVTEDYAGLNITFVTEEPTEGEFTIVNIITGAFPDYNMSIDGQNIHVDISAGRAEIGKNSGIFFDLETKKIVDADGNQILFDDEGQPANKGTPICLSDINLPSLEGTFGIAQEIDEGNMNANKQCWVFVAAHSTGTTAENKLELGNTISHELAHLLGIEHDDGIKGSIMGETNSSNYGMDKGFTDGMSDTGMGDPADTDAQRKLRATLPAKEKSEPRTRTTSEGDTDQHGTSEQPEPAGNPAEDTKNETEKLRRVLQPHVIPAGGTLFIDPLAIFPNPADPVFTDTLLFVGDIIAFELFIEPGIVPEYVDAWFEIQIANLSDTSELNDFKVFVDGFELPNAFDGIDQTLQDDPIAGIIASQRQTLFLSNYLGQPEIEAILDDGVILLEMCIGGSTPWVSIDSVRFTVTDNFTPSVDVCLGDCNGDGFVNFNDLVAMLFQFGGPGTAECDADSNGVVNFGDLVSTLFLFGPCPF